LRLARRILAEEEGRRRRKVREGGTTTSKGDGVCSCSRIFVVVVVLV